MIDQTWLEIWLIVRVKSGLEFQNSSTKFKYNFKYHDKLETILCYYSYIFCEN